MSNSEKTVKGEEVPLPVTSATAENPPAIATTTSEEQAHSKSQRRVNLIWEVTQAILSYGIVGMTLYVDMKISLGSVEISANRLASLMQLNVMAGLVIGFYFGRVNHQNVGGVQLGR